MILGVYAVDAVMDLPRIFQEVVLVNRHLLTFKPTMRRENGKNQSYVIIGNRM